MNKLEEAIERLDRATTRLEAAYTAATAPVQQPPDCEACEAEKERLRAVAGEIAARVDNALARIRRVLGEEG